MFGSMLTLLLVSLINCYANDSLKESLPPEFNETEYKKLYPYNTSETPFANWKNQPQGTSAEQEEEEIIVSLTSHPPRIGTTWLAVESILRQTKKPNRIILNLAEQDFPNHILPATLEILKDRGLSIYFSPVNYKVATKLIPSLINFPQATIITVDDDRCYASDWLEQLLNQHKDHSHKIICPHVREYVWDTSDPSYPHLNYLKQKVVYNTPIHGIFEGFSGVLYPPHSLDEEVFNFEQFKRLTPCADDVWFQAMALKKGTKVIGLEEQISKRLFWPLEIGGTQETGLFHEHLSANDKMAYTTLYYYGLLEKVGLPIVQHMECPSCYRDIALIKEGEVFPLPTHSQTEKCKVCLNNESKRVLCIGAYDYGNIGDKIYKEILNKFLDKNFEVRFVPDTVRLSRKGDYISLSSKEEDFKFDTLIIGGGGILKDFSSRSSITYYLESAIQRHKPFFFVSVGLQTTITNIHTDKATEQLGATIKKLRKATAIFPRSIEDYFLLRSILGEEYRHLIILNPDIGYLYPSLLNNNLEAFHKEYITLIQTGSANVMMPDIQNLIRKKLQEFPSSKLIIMNMGGIEFPTQAKDFKEWDLFYEKSKEIFPEASVYMGDSLSSELKGLHYSNLSIRQSDLTPLEAARIIGSSHFVITGRYHGIVLARAFNIPYCCGISSYKCHAEEKAEFNPLQAKRTLDYLNYFIKNATLIPSPFNWDEEQRNTYIVRLQKTLPYRSIQFIQSMDNESIFQALQFGSLVSS